MGSTAEQTALLQRSLDHITAPEDWDQDVWVYRSPCGTAACLAGTAVILAGREVARAVLRGES